MTSSIIELQDDIIEEFAFFETKNQKYDYLIDLGKTYTPLRDGHKTEANLIKGCQSKVWIVENSVDGKLNFTGDSDSIIVKGLVSLILRVFSNHNPEEILATPIYFHDKIGLKNMLSMTRSNGLNAMIKQIKLKALAAIQEQKLA